MALDFYHGHGSPFSWRVHLALEHKKIAYNLKVLSFQAQDTKKPEFTAINPRGQVPGRCLALLRSPATAHTEGVGMRRLVRLVAIVALSFG